MAHSDINTLILLLYDPCTIGGSINDNRDDYDGDYYHFAHNRFELE